VASQSPDKNNRNGIKRNSITGLPVNNADPRTLAKRGALREALLLVLPAPELLGKS
jgi:hypothetical protein